VTSHAEKRGDIMLIEKRITENGIETVNKVEIAVARFREFEPPGTLCAGGYITRQKAIQTRGCCLND